MGYLLFSFFMVLFSFTSYLDNKQSFQQEKQEEERITTRRAIETVHYINAINDYLYAHPDVRNSAGYPVLTADQTGIWVDSAIHHVIFRHRVYVWQLPEKGLMHALKLQTLSSALLGTVKNRRLIDNGNADMGVAVPPHIPESAIVYLN